MGRPPRRFIQAAIALIERKGRYLICRRHAGRSFGGLWEFPGGKRKPGEPWTACLRRELREELGVSVRAVRPVGTLRHRYRDRAVTFKVFRCAIAQRAGAYGSRHSLRRPRRWRGARLGRRPRPLDAQALRWVRAGELSRYRFPPANRPLLACLRCWRGSRSRAILEAGQHSTGGGGFSDDHAHANSDARGQAAR